MRKLLLIGPLCLWSQVAFGAIANVDNCGGTGTAISGGANVSSPATFTQTITSGVAVVFVTLYGGTGYGTITLTWSGGGGAFTQIGAPSVLANSTLVAFASVSPTPGAGGTVTISWTGGIQARVLGCLATYSGTDTTNVATAFPNYTTTQGGTAAAPTITVTSAAGDLAAGMIQDDSNNSTSCTITTPVIYASTVGRVNCAGTPTSSGPSATLTGGLVGSTAANALGFAIKQAGAGASVIPGTTLAPFGINR